MRRTNRVVPERLLIVCIPLLALLSLATFPAPCTGADSAQSGDITGWEENSEYNKHYDLKTFDKTKGILQEIIDITPLPGMAPGIGVNMVLRESDNAKDDIGEMVTVHFGPKDHVRFLSYVAKPGDKLTVRGSWTTLDGKKVLLASKIKINEIFEFKVRRTSDGTPYWALSKEMLVKEKLEQ